MSNKSSNYISAQKWYQRFGDRPVLLKRCNQGYRLIKLACGAFQGFWEDSISVRWEATETIVVEGEILDWFEEPIPTELADIRAYCPQCDLFANEHFTTCTRYAESIPSIKTKCTCDFQSVIMRVGCQCGGA